MRERASSTARPRERSLLSVMIRFASGLAGDTASTPPAAAAASSKRPASKCERASRSPRSMVSSASRDRSAMRRASIWVGIWRRTLSA
jgi:hypothetical protein